MSKNFLLDKEQREAAIKVAQKQGVKTIYVTPRDEKRQNYFTVKNLALLSVNQDASQVAEVTVDTPEVAEGGGETGFKVLEQNSKDTVAAIEMIEDVSLLEKLKEHEAANKKRKGVLSAIDNRIEALGEQEPGGGEE